MSPMQLISPTAIDTIAWSLFCFLWQGAFIALGLKAALALLPRQRANLRYMAACTALLMMTVLPFITAWTATKSSPQELPRAFHFSPEVTSPLTTSSPATSGSLSTLWAGPPPSFPAVGLEKHAPTSASGAVYALFSPNLRSELGPWLPQLFALWLTGVLLLTLAHLGGWLRLRKLKNHGTSPVDPAWQKALERLAKHLGLQRPIALLASAQVHVPTVLGWLRPVVLVPVSAFTGLDARQLESILAHELAHIKRHDAWVNLLQVGVETLLFYHPAVWWVSGQIRILREHCCDDLAVAVCGDRRTYAHALANLEDLRASSNLPAFALAADGGSLVVRIRRLAGMETKHQHPARALAGGAMAIAFLALITLQALSGPKSYAQPEAPKAPQPASPMASVPEVPAPPAGVPQPPTPPTPPSPSVSPQAPQAPTPPHHRFWNSRAPESPGHWIAERDEDSIWLRMRIQKSTGGTGTMGFSLDRAALTERIDGFELQREAGTISFLGSFTDNKGSGTFEFKPNPGYAKRMAALGYRDLPSEDIFELAIFDVGPELVEELASLGYDNISLERLVEVAIHDVDPEYIQAMAATGYDNLPLERLIEFRIHRITPDYVQEMASVGFENLDAKRIVEFSIHRITPDYVQEMANVGFEDLGPKRIIEFSIHRITPDYVQEMANVGFENLDPKQIIEFSIHRVTPDYVREMADMGFEGLDPRRIIEFSIHRVTPDYVQEMANVGFEDLDPRRIIEFSIHRVTPDYVRDLANAGFEDLDPRRIIEFSIHRVTPEFIQEMVEKGHKDLSPEDLIQLRIHGGQHRSTY